MKTKDKKTDFILSEEQQNRALKNANARIARRERRKYIKEPSPEAQAAAWAQKQSERAEEDAKLWREFISLRQTLSQLSRANLDACLSLTELAAGQIKDTNNLVKEITQLQKRNINR